MKSRRLHSEQWFAILLSIEVISIIALGFRSTRDGYTAELTADRLSSDIAIPMQSLPGINAPGYYMDNSLGDGKTDAADNSPVDDHTAVIETVSEPVDLAAGSYDIILEYSNNANDNTYSFSSVDNTWPVLAGHTHKGIETGENLQTSVQISSTVPVEGFQVHYEFNGNGYLYATGLIIRENGRLWRTAAVLCAIVYCLLDAVIICLRKGRRESAEDLCLALALALFSSLPVLTVYLPQGFDTEFHLGRIEALWRAISAGDIPLRVSPYWLNGAGYASSLFYCDLFLTVPALMRLAGFTVCGAYRAYVLFINLLTAAIAYRSFRRITGRRFAGWTGSILYMLAPYRLSAMFIRGAVGDYTAMAFLPLIIYGLWALYTEKEQPSPADLSGRHTGSARISHELHEWKTVLPLITGFSGVIESHVLTTFISAVCVILAGLILARYTFTKRSLLRILRGIAGVFLLNAWYIGPFADAYASGALFSMDMPDGRFCANGAHLYQIFSLFPYGLGFSTSIPEEAVNTMEMPYSLGAGLVFALLIYIVLRIHAVTRDPDGRKKPLIIAGELSGVIACLMLWMSTELFPWDGLRHALPFVNKIANGMQFPWRFLSAATALLTVLAAVAVWMVTDNGIITAEGKKMGQMPARLAGDAGIVMVIGALISGGYLMSGVCYQTPYLSNSESGSEYSDQIMNSEYLPAGSDRDMAYEDPIPGENVEIADCDRQYGVITLACSNSSADSESYVDVPFIYYVGYRAEDVTGSGDLNLTPGEEMRVRVVLPACYQGTIRVSYKGRGRWKLYDIITLVTLAGVIAVEMAERTVRKV